MKYSTTASVLALAASSVIAQDMTRKGKFQIATFNVTGQDIPGQGVVDCKTTPIITLNDGKLLDQDGRTGEIVANRQFQFDEPVQGPTVTGFGIYPNGSLAINGNALFYSCLSGTFSNLYDQKIAEYCVPIYIVTYPCSGSGATVDTQTGSSSSATSYASSSTMTTAVSSSSESSVSYTPGTTSAYMPVMSAPVMTSVAPYPQGNATVPAGTATGTGAGATTTAGSSSTASIVPANPNAASSIAVGGKIVAVLAGIVAYAMI